MLLTGASTKTLSIKEKYKMLKDVVVGVTVLKANEFLMESVLSTLVLLVASLTNTK